MKALIIDDHPIFVSALKALLRQSVPGAVCETAESVGEALEKLEWAAEFQLVLLDLSLPGLDGFSFLRALEQRGVHAPVVVVSANEEPETMRAAIAAGAVGFIPKSYRSERMSEALRRVLDGELYLPEEAAAPVSADDGEGERLARCATLGLGRKHHQVLRCLADGLTNKEIAERLYISVHTVKAHNAKLFQQLHTSNRTDTVREAIRLGLIDS